MAQNVPPESGVTKNSSDRPAASKDSQTVKRR